MDLENKCLGNTSTQSGSLQPSLLVPLDLLGHGGWKLSNLQMVVKFMVMMNPMAGWWFQPIRKILVKMGIFPK